jgi:hypothetical protein
MFYMMFNARVDTSHHWPPHQLKVHVVTDSLAGIHNAMVVPLRCQQTLHKQGSLGGPTSKSPEDLNLASVEAMQWVLLYPSIGHDSENISHSTAKMVRSTITHVPHFVL